MVLAACLSACGTDSGERQPAGAPGAIDTTFGEGGIRRLSYPASADDVRLDSQGRVLLASHYGPLNEALFTRVFTDGGFDQSLFRRMPAIQSMAAGSAVFPAADGGFIGVLKGGSFVPMGMGRVAASRFDSGGEPDPTYGSAGTALVSQGGNYEVIGDADGTIVVLGALSTIVSGPSSAHVVRLDPAGRRVPEYESRAEDMLAACGGSVGNGYRGAFQPDSRLVLVIAEPLRPLWCIARLNADGTPDTDFGTGGRLQLLPPLATVWTGPRKVLVRPNGSIVVLFAFRAIVDPSPIRTAFLWVTNDGRVDASLGTAGVCLIDDALIGDIVDASTQADGRLLLVGYPLKATAGSPYLFPDATRPRIVRLGADCRLDTAFGPSGDGIVPLEAGGNRLLPTRVIASGVGTAYVAGGAVPVGPVNDLAYLSLSVTKIFTGER